MLAWVSTIPALALLHRPPQQSAGLVSHRRVDLRAGLRGRGARPDSRVHAVPPVARRSRSRRAIPYRGWMRWHYVTGAVFGLFTLTFAFSGLLSMEPFAWTNAPDLRIDRATSSPAGRWSWRSFPAGDSRHAGTACCATASSRKSTSSASRTSRTSSSTRRSGRGLRSSASACTSRYYITGRAERDRTLIAARTLEARDAFTAGLAGRAAAGRAARRRRSSNSSCSATTIPTTTRATGRRRCRSCASSSTIRQQTWVYIDPAMSRIVSQVHRSSRVERWLYNGLHSLDFAFWYNKRPLWDIGMIVLLLGGLATSSIGLFLGIKRVRRSAVNALTPVPDAHASRRIDITIGLTAGSQQDVRRSYRTGRPRELHARSRKPQSHDSLLSPCPLWRTPSRAM